MKELRERALFWRQLALLLESGVPILAALSSLHTQLQGRSLLAPAVERLASALQGGWRLSEAMASHPHVFRPVDRAMVRVGEGSGSLVMCLHRLATWLERDCETQHRSRNALLYPAFVLAVSAVLVILLVSLVVPAFAGVLFDLKVALPLPTQLLLAVSQLLARGWPLLGLAALVAFAGYVLVQWLATESGYRQVFQAGLRVPLIGRLLSSTALARYTDALHLLLEPGTDLLLALKLAAEVSGHPLLIEDAPHLVEAIRDGDSLSGYLRANSAIYSRALAQPIHSGEESDRLGRFLVVAHRSFSLETELVLALLNALLEPLLITGVALVVGGVVLSVLLPIYASLQGL